MLHLVIDKRWMQQRSCIDDPLSANIIFGSATLLKAIMVYLTALETLDDTGWNSLWCIVCMLQLREKCGPLAHTK